MKNKTAKQIINTYNIWRALVCVGYLLALAVLIFVMTRSIVIGIVGIIVLASTIKNVFIKLEEKILEPVIFDELDPEKFNELLSLGAFKNSTRHKVLAAVSLGEHEKALEIINNYSSKIKNPLDLCNNTYRKGYIHFEREEYDKLPQIIREYEALKTEYPQFVGVFNNFSVFDKFDAFVDEDYEYVVDVCDIDLKEINPKKQNHKMTKINVGFYRAVSLYKLGRMDEAKKGFEDVIEFAPRMYKAKLSRDYIERIKNER